MGNTTTSTYTVQCIGLVVDLVPIFVVVVIFVAVGVVRFLFANGTRSG